MGLNADLFKSKTGLKEQEWTSANTGARFVLVEPTVEQNFKIAELATRIEKGDAEATKDLIIYIWTHCVQEPDTGEPAFTPSPENKKALLNVSMGELTDVMKLVLDMVPRPEAMPKNSQPTS